MIVDLADTSTGAVLSRLREARDAGGAVALSRVLTLIVGVDDPDDAHSALASAEDAAREHPCRMIAVVRTPEDAPPEGAATEAAATGSAGRPDGAEDRHGGSRLDARVRIGADAGASEVVELHLSGTLSAHGDAVVAPFLLPDTPVVTWWPGNAPAVPAEDPLGIPARRRMTGPPHDGPGTAVARLRSGYRSGDTDLSWSAITPWRAVLAAAMDHPHVRAVRNGHVQGPADSCAPDMMAGWLSSTLGVPVRRTAGPESVILDTDGGSVRLIRSSSTSLTLRVPGERESRIASPRRSVAECLAEDLRSMQPDEIYSEALAGTATVDSAARRAGSRDDDRTGRTTTL